MRPLAPRPPLSDEERAHERRFAARLAMALLAVQLLGGGLVFSFLLRAMAGVPRRPSSPARSQPFDPRQPLR
jgi:hypothetical protein